MAKNLLEDSADKRLDEKELAEKGEREIEAHEPEPLYESGVNAKPIVVRVIEECGNKTHRRNHKTYRSADDCRLKQNRMGSLGVKVHAGQLKRKRASVNTFHRIGETEFNKNHRPDWHNAAEHIDSADFPHGRKNAGSSSNGAESVAVHDIDTVKNEGMDGDYNSYECKYHPLKLISWHKKLQ